MYRVLEFRFPQTHGVGHSNITRQNRIEWMKYNTIKKKICTIKTIRGELILMSQISLQVEEWPSAETCVCLNSRVYQKPELLHFQSWFPSLQGHGHAGWFVVWASAYVCAYLLVPTSALVIRQLFLFFKNTHNFTDWYVGIMMWINVTESCGEVILTMSFQCCTNNNNMYLCSA